METAAAQEGREGHLGIAPRQGGSRRTAARRLLEALRPRLGPGLLLEALVLALVVAWFFLFRPQFLGGPAAYVIVSGHSMVPTMQDGDLVIVHRQDAYAPGDIVAYRIPKGEPGEGHIVIHRIVGGSAEEGYITKGDNRSGPDLWRPRPEDVLGKAWLHVPAVGDILGVLRSPLVLAAVAAVAAAVLVLTSADERRREGEGE
ncbi:LexA repressor [bacterium HR24]|nr:LexA repressor [bacterium HR24]